MLPNNFPHYPRRKEGVPRSSGPPALVSSFYSRRFSERFASSRYGNLGSTVARRSRDSSQQVYYVVEGLNHVPDFSSKWTWFLQDVSPIVGQCPCSFALACHFVSRFTYSDFEVNGRGISVGLAHSWIISFTTSVTGSQFTCFITHKSPSQTCPIT